MDATLIMPLARAVERVLTVAAGVLAIYCGYRLFSMFPAAPTDSSGRLELPGVKVVFARVGPGLLFAALGIAVLAVSLRSPISIRSDERGIVPSGPTTVAVAPAVAPAGTKPVVHEKVITVSGSVGSARATPAALVAQLAELACVERLALQNSAKYPGSSGAAKEAVQTAREALVLASWQKEWGDPDTFRRWVSDEATPGVAPVVQQIYFTRAPKRCEE
jgi:hypothetical protein